MKELILVMCLFGLFIIGAGVANLLAFLITYRPLISIKPFNCMPCLSHWLTFAINGILGVMLISLDRFAGDTLDAAIILFAAFLSGLVSYFYNKSKFKVYE